MAEKKTYYAAEAGFVEGTHYERHQPVRMTEAAAKYLVLQGTLLTAVPVAKKEIPNAGGAKPDKGGN